MVNAHTVDMPAALVEPTYPPPPGSTADREQQGKLNGYNNYATTASAAAAAPSPFGVAADAWPLTSNGGLVPPRSDTGSAKDGVATGGLGALISSPGGDSRSERAPGGKSTTIPLRSRRSGGLDGGRRRSGESAARQEMAPRPGAAEEGYFSPVPVGKPAAPGGKTSSLTNGSATSPDKKPSQPLPMSPGSSLPPLAEALHDSSRQRELQPDGMLLPPVTRPHHRASSPPAFSQPSGATSISSQSAQSTTSPSRPERLTHRHTLEVPRLSTKSSRDELTPVKATDGFASPVANRFSPTTPQKRSNSLQLARRVTQSWHSHSDMHLDEAPQDDDAARWTEHIKAKRASKKARVDTDDERVVVGTRVDEKHVNFITMYNMLTGIRFTVSRTNAKLPRDLTEADFVTKQKFRFDISGNELTPSTNYDFKFKDYAPWVFRHLRGIFGLDPADYLVSLTAKYILSELGSPGKSGSFFYFSRDYKYIIKTIHHSEHRFLRSILKDYYKHVIDNPNTLLSQFYGLHRVKMPYGRKTHFVVMNNLFPPHRDIHRTFDLKGSTIGRDFKEEDLEKNPRATLKDLNWLRRNLHLEFGPMKKEVFVEQMQRDVALLQRLKIMDYSLLVGIHDLGRGNEENLRDKTLTVFQPGGKQEESPLPVLTRTPSKLEASKRAKELREMVKKERPKPLGQDLDELPEDQRKDRYFYADDGGFRASHEDNRPGDVIYYLGIIDCLTRYGMTKKAEHLWKGLGGKESQISPVPPDRYGDRFVRFISGITKSRERAEQERLSQTIERVAGIHIPPGIEGTVDDPKLGSVNRPLSATMGDARDPPGTEKVMAKAERQAKKSMEKGRTEEDVPDRTLTTIRTPDAVGVEELLPVIGEAAESASNTSRTPSKLTPRPSTEDAAIGRTSAPLIGDANMPSHSIGVEPPPTPPKLDGSRYDQAHPDEDATGGTLGVQKS